jgi:hypothetical protein
LKESTTKQSHKEKERLRIEPQKTQGLSFQEQTVPTST